MTQSELPALHGVRVLDLTTQRAELAGRILAELGAEVLKLEPPGGPKRGASGRIGLASSYVTAK